MKNIYVVIFGTMMAFCVSNPNIVATNSKVHSHYCTFSSQNHSIENIEVWFDDPDGDCKSNRHFTTYHYKDGNINSYDTGKIFGELDFSKFTCCNLFVSNSHQSAQEVLEQLAM